MDELQVSLIKKIDELTGYIDTAQNCMQVAPEGSLYVMTNRGNLQYYHRKEATDPHGIYIKKSETKFIKQLAQKEYAKKIYAKAMIERDKLKKYLANYNPDVLTNIYHTITTPKQQFVTPYILSDEEYIAQWKAKKLREKEQYGKDDLLEVPEEQAIITEQGERVRSKSEKILADKFNMLNIPYVYECPLYVKGYGYIRPDFIVLNVRTREEYFWEHLGLMDDKEYSKKAVLKIESYERNQIYPGKKLLLTYEMDKHPLNMKIVEGLIEEHLL